MGLRDQTRQSIIVAMTEAQQAHGPQPEDSPAQYVNIFTMVAVGAGDLVTAKELMDNRREAEQIVAGVLGMM